MIVLKYKLEGLDCPNCTEKLRQKIAAIDEINDVQLSYPEGICRIQTDADEEEIEEKLFTLVHEEEPEVSITELHEGHDHHDHEHHHSHEHHHDEHCEHDHCECEEHHHHDHEHHHEEKAIYYLEVKGVDCEHCAAELQEKVAALEGLENVRFSFADSLLEFTCDHDLGKEMTEKVMAVISENEPEAVVTAKGHAHVHEHHHDEHCECDEHHHEEKHHTVNDRTRRFSITGIDCADCAAKLEGRLEKISGIENVSISFMNSSLMYDCDEQDKERIEKEIREITAKEEPDAVITPLSAGRTYQFRIHNIDCADCAAKLAVKAGKISGVIEADADFMHEILSVSCEPSDFDRIRDAVIAMVKDEEPEVEVSLIEKKAASAETEEDNDKVMLIRLIAGAVLFIASLFVRQGSLQIILPVCSWLVLGYDVLLKAIRGIGRGQLFDEHFLMTVATIAAMYLKDYREAAGVMLFYQGANCADTNWGSGKASFGGKELWAARRYTDYSKEEQVPRAFVASFSVKDYDKINIHSLVAANNSCVRQRQLLQLSTTSSTEGFTTLKTLTLSENPSSEWVNMDYELDTKAIDGMVYIRWIEDETSDFFDGGSHSGTEGFYLADVIIFADQTAADDTEAPQLVSSSPAEGSTSASARGNIVLSFNERVKAGTGTVTLNGETLAGSFGSKSVTYAYHGLTYGQQYTLSIGADAITDLSGNAFPARDITFTVMERPQPSAKVFDAVVAQDGTGDYKTVQEAIDAAPTGRIAPWLIFVKNGTYEELVTIPENKPFIHLIGQDKEKTVISYWINNGGSSDIGWDYSTNNPSSKTYGKQGVVQVNSTDFYTENISYIDSYGVEKQAGPMGLAMSSRNDRQAFNNCQFRSYQDTWYTDVRNSSARQYVNNCLIEGAVDFYYGAGDNFIENSTFRLAREGSVIVAPSHQAGTKWGYVMVNNVIDGKGGANKLGRAWQNQPMAVWINTTLKTTIAAEGWSEWHIAPKLFAEYNTMDADGQPVDLNNRRTTYKVDDDKLAPGETSPVTRQAILSAEEAARYTYEAVTSGNDDWNPRKFFEPVEAPAEVVYANGKLTWKAVPYAICYLVMDAEGNVVGMTKDAAYAIAEAGTYTLRSVNEYGSLGESTNFEVTEAMTTGIQAEKIIQVPFGETQVYDLQGRKMADGQLQRGIYLLNGRKMIVR